MQILNIGVGDPIRSNYEMFFWILMGANIILIALAKNLNQNYFRALFRTAIFNRHLLQNVQEELKLQSASSILLTLTYFTNLAVLFSFALSSDYGKFMLILLGVLVGAALIKWAAMWSAMFVVEQRSGIIEHGMNHLIFYQVGGLILTPILIVSHFFPSEIYELIVFGCLIFTGVLLLYRDVQSIGRAIKVRISPLYIILYLCTLEIMPFVLIIYAFVNNNTGLN